MNSQATADECMLQYETLAVWLLSRVLERRPEDPITFLIDHVGDFVKVTSVG